MFAAGHFRLLEAPVCTIPPAVDPAHSHGVFATIILLNRCARFGEFLGWLSMIFVDFLGITLESM